MKKLLCLLLLFAFTGSYAQSTETDSTDTVVYPLWPKAKTHKKSIFKFRTWLADEYANQLMEIKRTDKATYDFQKHYFIDCTVRLKVTETGNMEIIETSPETLCVMQRTVIEKTIEQAPIWTPGTKNGKATGFTFSVPIQHASDLFIERPKNIYPKSQLRSKGYNQNARFGRNRL